MKLIWSRAASRELETIGDYIRRQSPAAAKRTLAEIAHQVDMLTRFPEMGRIGRILDTRELVISGTPYIVPYRIRNSVIEVLSVIHGARRWPDSFD
jgi:toxin ParE1/3/4